ncbi:MAG: hypothetical protein JAY60_18450 [Candidatus Thiodiazotropha weberae]|nr:hypothetical protein [Candidatus Thiodiazotropha weberae]
MKEFLEILKWSDYIAIIGAVGVPFLVYEETGLATALAIGFVWFLLVIQSILNRINLRTMEIMVEILSNHTGYKEAE